MPLNKQNKLSIIFASLALFLISGTVFAALTFNSLDITSDGAISLNPTSAPVTVNGDLTVTGTCTGCGGGAPTTATYITQTANGTLSAEQALGALATGILKNTTTTGVLSIAADGTDYVGPLSQSVVQVVNTQTGAVSSSTATIPVDDSIPQNTEGFEVMTLAITPTSSSNKLKIEVTVHATNSDTFTWIVAALFQDSTANALAASWGFNDSNTAGAAPITFTHYMTAGTTSATTFKVRIGGYSAGTTTFNGQSGARRFGGVMASSITITEIVP